MSERRPRSAYMPSTYSRKVSAANISLHRDLQIRLNLMNRDCLYREKAMKRQISSLKVEILDRKRELEDMRAEKVDTESRLSTQTLPASSKILLQSRSNSTVWKSRAQSAQSFYSDNNHRRQSYYSILEIPTEYTSYSGPTSAPKQLKRPRTSIRSGPPHVTKPRPKTAIGTWLERERYLSRNLS